MHSDYDLLAMDAVGMIALEDISPHDVRDTRAIAYLLDSRPSGVGNGIGHGLKPLSDVWIDPEASARGQAIVDDEFRENGWSKGEGFTKISIHDPDFIIYSALDAWLTRRLVDIFEPHLAERGLNRLEAFDNEVADACRKMRRHGLQVDHHYVESELIPYLEAREAEGRREALAYGVENIHSTRQVSAALQAMGWTPAEFTPSGQPKVDKTVLADLVDGGNSLAGSIMKAKQAAKYLNTYAVPLIEESDSDGRVHPEIRPTGAITGRMSVAKPALQQLPSTGEDAWRVRRAIVAGEGLVFGSCDLSQVELRLMGALAEERKMIDAVVAGEDIYDTIASSIYGDGFTPGDRKTAKMIALARIFGSGNATIARQAGLTVAEATEVVKKYDDRFPRIKAYSRRLQDRASLGRREVITPSGRRIPQEADALYRAVNHTIQSTAADYLKQSLLRLIHEGGMVPGPDISLLIHDEILFTSTPERFDDRALTVRSFMTSNFLGMPIEADSTLIGPSWGDGYRPS
jgi:DNA polymerase-1